MQNDSINKKAQKIRDVIRYIDRFKNAIVVIYIDSSIIDSPLFSSHIHDISLIHKAGLKVIIVPGAKNKIDEILALSNISWKYKNDIRITNEKAMTQIKMAAFDISTTVMTSFAANKLPAVIGNWVRARSIGVIDGQDFGSAGEIEKLQLQSIHTILQEDFIPILPCIGWSATGKPYNISSVTLAKEIAIQLQADKLFFLVPDAKINKTDFTIPSEIYLSNIGTIPALNIEEVKTFIKANKKITNKNDNTKKIISLLQLSKTACENGVSRIHILNGFTEGVIPCEIFSDVGSGTMIYSKNYGNIREMKTEDITLVLSLMRPFVESGKILERSEKDLYDSLKDYIVYELDGGIRACAALHIYSDKQAEIAAVAVDETFSNSGVGPKLIDYLIQKAKSYKVKSVFILTTQAADWFEGQGFMQDNIATLPEKRKAKWSEKRGSKIYRLKL